MHLLKELIFDVYVCVGVQVRQLERTLTMRDLQLAESEQNLRELQFCTYDGVFIWKISDFSRRRQDALAGRAPAMFSPGTSFLELTTCRHKQLVVFTHVGWSCYFCFCFNWKENCLVIPHVTCTFKTLSNDNVVSDVYSFTHLLV